MSKTLILYNGIDPFENLGTTPFISKANTMIRNHDRWCVATQLVLNGIISGNCSDFNSLINNQKELINNFAQDFKSLQIIEENQSIANFPYTTIESVKFDQNKYYRIVPFEITINCYQENLFSGVYGVLDPVNNISYQEDEESTITAIRTISARGFNSNSSNFTNNGFNNAKNWVQGKTGWNFDTLTLPYFINYNTGILAPCLKEQKERIDRFNNFYEITERYTWNKYATSSTIVKYSVDSSYQENNGIYEVNIEGNVEGCPDDDIENVRNIYKNLDLYSITNFEFLKSFPSEPSLNPEYLSDQVQENTNKRTLSFSRSYDNDLRSPIFLDYEITVDYDVLSDTHSISFNGVIRSRNSQKIRWERVLAYYESLNVFNLVQDFYVQNGYPYSLISYPINYNVTENEFVGEITIQASYNNKKQPEPGFDKFNFNINIEPSINQYLPIPVICGDYTLLNLNALRRAKITINGEAFSLQNIDKTETVRTIAKSILNQYIESPANSRVIKSDNISKIKEAQGYKYDFEYSESYSGPQFLT